MALFLVTGLCTYGTIREVLNWEIQNPHPEMATVGLF